jgi:hypothetical protein
VGGQVSKVRPVATGRNSGNTRGRVASCHHVAARSDVAPDIPDILVVVVANLLIPLAAEFQRRPEFAEEREHPPGVQLGIPNLGRPFTGGILHPRAAGEVREVEPVATRDLSNRPLP